MNMRDDPGLYAIPADIDDRLRNWARWAKVRRWQSSCGSVEKFYQPRAGDTLQEVKPMERADLWDAFEVEKAWAYKLPMREKMALKAAYIGPQGRGVRESAVIQRRTAAMLNIAARDLPALVYRSAVMISNMAKAPHFVRSAA